MSGRSLAERGASPHEIMAITGHRSLEEVERYTRSKENRTGKFGYVEAQIRNIMCPTQTVGGTIRRKNDETTMWIYAVGAP